MKYIVTAIVRGGKWSSLEPHSFINYSAGLDHKTEKAKYKYGICVHICSNFSLNVRQAITICKSRLFYAVRTGTE